MYACKYVEVNVLPYKPGTRRNLERASLLKVIFVKEKAFS